ncbi:hypothetical protein PO883_05095 [Massilia sp. DJPM01]|uniref:hypothetical protein n=1 Tax=Massilia sp. DJPM01 TaxID=3024404 RepID=UPI00259F546B|nr:hypothetical protein [Massilia sp. DJPM01]MDM5176571.1 hypothetical protein [Massilia sp. DJPM01]
MTDKFVPTANAATLSSQCAALVRASGDLMHTLTVDLALDKQEGLNRLLTGGGRVGIKVTIDRNGNNEISLVGVEREGRHLTLATVATVGNGVGVAN